MTIAVITIIVLSLAIAALLLLQKPQTFRQSKLEYLAEKVNAQVVVKINSHKDSEYTSAALYLNAKHKSIIANFDVDTLEMMIDTDTIIEIDVYVHNSVGHYKIWHYDLEDAIDESLELLKK